MKHVLGMTFDSGMALSLGFFFGLLTFMFLLFAMLQKINQADWDNGPRIEEQYGHKLVFGTLRFLIPAGICGFLCFSFLA